MGEFSPPPPLFLNHADAQTSNTSTRLWFYYIITKIHPPFQNPGSAPVAIVSCATFLFLPRFDVICDLLLNRRTATWNLFVKVIINAFELEY